MSSMWQFSTPDAEGLDSGVLNQLDAYIKQKRYRLVNSVLLVKNGKIVFEKYYNKFNETSRNHIKSIWKSILAITTGICLDKGIIRSLDDPIGKYVQEFAGQNHPYHKLITIRHLLTMSSGIYWNGGVHYHCPMITQMKRTSDWISHMADIDMKSVPGMSFQYKEWDVMLLSAVIGNAYGGTAYDITQKYLYEPLGITSDEWPMSPCGFSYTVIEGEEKSDLSGRDLAKIGLLFLENGIYDGKQILTSEYIKQVITPSYKNNSNGSLSSNHSYGYLWWLFTDGYGCRGFGGQEVNVIPEKQLVSVIQATPTSSSKAYGDIQENIFRRAII